MITLITHPFNAPGEILTEKPYEDEGEAHAHYDEICSILMQQGGGVRLERDGKVVASFETTGREGK